MKKFYIETYGCQMNKAESSSLIKLMEDKGFIYTQLYYEADVVIINTCSVRKTAENRIWGRVGFFKRQKRERKIIVLVMGCMSQRIGEELINSNRSVDIVVGNFYKERIPEIIINHRDGEKGIFIDEGEIVFTKPCPDETNPARSYVTISHGCNNFCTYCIVPYLRGREVSKNSSEIVGGIQSLTEQGVLQVILLGQNVNSYGADKNDLDFPDLLRKIADETDIQWIKFLSSHPKDLSDKLIEVIASEQKVSKWVHLALQSGSDRVLERMNRKYTAEDFKLIVGKLRQAVPDILITTDIIVGFPGETDEEYQQTLDLVQWVEFDDAFLYKYNERDTTLAQKKFDDDISDEVKTERITELIAIQRAITTKRRELMVGKQYGVIPDRFTNDGTDRILAVSQEEVMFIYPGSKEDFGKIIQVEAVGVSGSTVIGKKI